MQTFKAAITYFGLIFTAGFLLGIVRVLLLVPWLGERIAELLEMPLMLTVIVFVARWLVRRFRLPRSASIRLSVGLIALGLLLALEFTLVLWLRGLSIDQYIASRDPVAGTVYLLMLGVFALMPLLVHRDLGDSRMRSE